MSDITDRAEAERLAMVFILHNTNLRSDRERDIFVAGYTAALEKCREEIKILSEIEADLESRNAYLQQNYAEAKDDVKTLLKRLAVAREALKYIDSVRDRKCQDEQCTCAYDTARKALEEMGE